MSSLSSSAEHVLGLDVGTTTIRAFVYSKTGVVVGHSQEKVTLLYPRPGFVEIDPDHLWVLVVSVLKGALKASGLSARDIRSVGISTQRATFVLWDSETGKELHHFITWKDTRSDDLVNQWNSSWTMRSIRAGSSLMWFLTRQKRYFVGKILKLQNKMVVMRLLWALLNIESVKKAVSRGTARFGTVDTWLLFKMTGKHITDIGNASTTGLYDPFTLSYADWAFNAFSIPRRIMPEVVDSAGSHLGSVPADLLDGSASVPIHACLADQSAATFGAGCHQPGMSKMSLGSGSFLDVNTGTLPHASINGLVPLVGWRYKDSLVFLAEGSNHDTGSLIEWAKNMNLFEDPSDSSAMALRCPAEDADVYFVPAFCGLQAPFVDPYAGAALVGVSPRTGPDQVVRSVLEAIAFTMKHLVNIMEKESDHTVTNVQIDGGVSQNDFVVQLISDLTGKTISRASTAEVAAFGAAFLAGVSSGLWTHDDLSDLRRIERTFEPETRPEKVKSLRQHFDKWTDACVRMANWNHL